MKSFAALTLLASAVSAHYTFPALVYNGQTTKDWEYVRKTTNFNSHGPVEDRSLFRSALRFWCSIFQRMK
ncbi:hypothetical protein PG995_015628 [Apiospora arundinis]